MNGPLLAAAGLGRIFVRRRSLIGPPRAAVRALEDVSLAVPRGASIGVVGESGSGKTTLARLLAGLDTPSAGTVTLDGRPLASFPPVARYRRVQYVFQDPTSALNPRKRVQAIIAAPLQALLGMSRPARRTRVQALLRTVGLTEAHAGRYPHAFSGGQAQRIVLARALAAQPEILILDEPVSALDVSIQAQLLVLLRELRRRLGLTYVFVSHDLAVVEQICDSVLVMQRGRIVEAGPCRTVFRQPQHPYTRELIAAVPRLA